MYCNNEFDNNKDKTFLDLFLFIYKDSMQYFKIQKVYLSSHYATIQQVATHQISKHVELK